MLWIVFKESGTKAVQNFPIKKLIAGNNRSKPGLEYSLYLPVLKPWLDAFFAIVSEPRYTQQSVLVAGSIPQHTKEETCECHQACMQNASGLHLGEQEWDIPLEPAQQRRARQAVPHHPSHTAGTAGCSAPTASSAGSWCGRTPAAGRPKGKQERWCSLVALSYWLCRLGQGWGCKPILRAPWVKDVFSIGGETTSTVCTQKIVLIGCTKLKLFFRGKNKAGERNPDLDLTATSAVEDFRVRVLSAHHTEIWMFNRSVLAWRGCIYVRGRGKTIHLCHLKCLSKLFSFESTWGSLDLTLHIKGHFCGKEKAFFCLQSYSLPSSVCLPHVAALLRKNEGGRERSVNQFGGRGR